MSDKECILWNKPVHHQDAKHAGHHVGWIELFYDLIHVVCVFILGDYLSHHLGLNGALGFIALFVLVWVAWSDTIFYTSLYVSDDLIHRIIMALQICTIMVFAFAIPNLGKGGEMIFALGYGANRLLLAIFYLRAAAHNHSTKSLAWMMGCFFVAIALTYFISAFVPNPWNYVIWALAVLATQLAYLLPKIGFLSYPRFIPRLMHLSERFALLMLIVIGEGFFKMVVTLADTPIAEIDGEIITNYAVGGMLLFVLAWSYFDFVGFAEPKVHHRLRNLVVWWYAHLLAMMAAIMIGVSLKGLVKIGLFAPFPLKYALLGCPGLALFIICGWLMSTAVPTSIASGFIDKYVRLFGIGLALMTLAVISFVPTIVGNVLFATALLSQVLIPVYRSYHFVKANPAN